MSKSNDPRPRKPQPIHTDKVKRFHSLPPERRMNTKRARQLAIQREENQEYQEWINELSDFDWEWQ